MASAWHTPHDPREFSDAPLDMACDTFGCNGIVRVAAEDWHDNDGYWCCACVVRAVIHAHDASEWPADIPA
jgi:hypothetical protein